MFTCGAARPVNTLGGVVGSERLPVHETFLPLDETAWNSALLLALELEYV